MKINGSKVLILSLVLIIILIYVFYFAYIKVDTKSYFEYLTNTVDQLADGNLSQLLNGNSLVNLPIVTYTTNNIEINHLQRCKQGPVFMGVDTNVDFTQLCFNTCGSTGRPLIIEQDQQYYFNNVQLTPGVWCATNITDCNMRTGYVVASINSVVCRTKYPNMFGGVYATNIVACSNEFIPNNNSLLWDNLYNERVNPLTISMTNEDELLPDGSYRFTCKYGLDSNGNPLLPHPLNRFQPITDICNNTIYKASFEVHANISDSGWFCDCGTFNETRVQNIDPDNPKSTCTSCLHDYNSNDNTYTIPYNCFTVNSPFRSLFENSMCNASKYTTYGNLCDTFKMQATDVTNDRLSLNNLPFKMSITSLNTSYTID